MTSNEIRQQFLDFFQEKAHQYVHSAPLVLKNDPSLMFTNAGMNQFKDYFLGNKIAENKRVANSQKCLRVSGKHNDLDDVGADTYHHTMFEMLGNWSFGDYFKKEAIAWGWELLTEVYGLPKDRLYVTVFGGDKNENLESDEEAKDFWKQHVSEDRILYGSKKDNFWEMGETGPCGPCSEIHIDIRDEAEIQEIAGADLVNQDHPLVIEIWNLVFIQFNRKADRSLKQLPDKHVDTGMGFERLAMVVQGKNSNYDTDVFTPLIEFIEKASGKKYNSNEKITMAMRVLADHIRAVSFAIADGQLPSNTGAGYVIRRILRRAVRYGFTFLGFNEPFFYRLLDIIAEQFANIFPELEAQQDFIRNVIKEEETSFLRTLEKGLKLFEEIKSNLKSDTIDGETAFELYDTFGFPLDLTQLIARENNLKIDQKGFDKAMEAQKTRARKAQTSEKGDWIFVQEGDEPEFIGYDFTETTSKILRYREIKEKKKTLFQLVLDKTPFYAEAGGQIGDKGLLISENEKVKIIDTKKENDLIIHFAKKLPKNLTANFESKINLRKRKSTENNHSATHLLHAALRQVLGNHVEQRGSLVNSEYLRFDFSHPSKITNEQLSEIEQIVNQKIRENIPLNEYRNIPIDEAKEMGAMALFGEKYGDFVRTIVFDKDYSVELCGGTHVQATGQIGLLKITSESSIAAGIRRIEAVTGEGAEKLVNEQFKLIVDLKNLLKNPKNLTKAVEKLAKEKNQLSKEIEALHRQEIARTKSELMDLIEQKDDHLCLVQKVNLPSADAMKQIAFQLRNQFDNLAMLLGTEIQGRPHLALLISDKLVESKNLNASQIIRDLAKEIKGGGGGQPFFATAAGRDINGLEKALEKAKTIF